MARLLLNLRNVPDDEAAEVRGWLEEHGFAWYETRPSPWGISHGGIWLHQDAELPRARSIMSDYQAQRRQQARDARERALRDGSAETFGSLLRRRPGYVLGVLAAIAGILGLTLALPYWLLR